MMLVTLIRHPFRTPSDELDDLRDCSPRAVYRWAIARGWSADEAGNWSAWYSGLALVDGEKLPKAGWTLRAVGHALFLRYLAETGQIGGPTDSPMVISPTVLGSSPVTGPKG